MENSVNESKEYIENNPSKDSSLLNGHYDDSNDSTQIIPIKSDELNEDIVLDKDSFLFYYADKWDDSIADRGRDYYNDGKVLDVFKSKNKFLAKVEGSFDNVYDVEIEYKNDRLEISCTCPCHYLCKHSFAALMKIEDYDYKTVELKDTIIEKTVKLYSLIEQIPAEELKSYILSPTGRKNICIDKNDIGDYFSDYLPNQTYEFYYNNLYNELIINYEYEKLVSSYTKSIKKLISLNDFKEVFKIIKAIINAYKDADKINFDEEFIDLLPSLGMFLRIVYRKGDEVLRNEIESWTNDLKKDDYCNNFYLEDIIIGLKSSERMLNDPHIIDN